MTQTIYKIRKAKIKEVNTVTMVGTTAIDEAGEDDEDIGIAVPFDELVLFEEELVQVAKISSSRAFQNSQALKSIVLMFTVPFPTFRPIEL
jgi:hypothetical protein